MNCLTKSATVFHLALLLTLGGCGQMERKHQYGNLATAPESDYRRAPIEQWEGREKVVRLDETAPAQTFDSGKSFYRIVALPTSPRPMVLKVESGMNKAVGGFLQPELILLDSERNQFRSLGAPLRNSQPTYGGFLMGALRGFVEISDPYPISAFLMIRTSDELLKPGVPWKHTGLMIAPPLVVPISSEGRLKHWPMGVVRLEISESK